MSGFLIGILVFTGVIVLGLLVMRPFMTQYVDSYAVRVRSKKRLERETSAESPKESAILSTCQSAGEVVLNTFPWLVTKRTTMLLTQANYRTPQHLAIFMGIKAILVGCTVFIALIGAFGNPINLFGAIPMGFCGYVFPNFVLQTRVKARQAQCLRELPTVIDLLIVCAQAGLGLLTCVDKVCKEITNTCPVLTAEMQQLLNDVKIFAKPAAQALHDMGERCGVEELMNMISALIAAETKGSNISYPLRQQADALRDKIKRKKEEEASKTPVKMVPVIMFFIMPLVLCPMLGPAVITIMNSLGSAVGGHK